MSAGIVRCVRATTGMFRKIVVNPNSASRASPKNGFVIIVRSYVVPVGFRLFHGAAVCAPRAPSAAIAVYSAV
jgi:hypothetical protein